MKKRMLAVCMAVVCVMAFSGCGKEPAKSGGSSSGPAASSSGDKSQDQSSASAAASYDDVDLYNKYVGVYNMITGDMYDAIDGYFTHVPYQEEFAAPEESDYWCYSISEYNISYLDYAYDADNGKKEKAELDNALIALYPVMKDLALAINDVEEYTDMKSFADDNYAKGAELHTRIYNDYQQYADLSQAYLDAADPVFEKVQEEDLKRFKDEGMDMSYTMNMVMDCAQDIQEAIYLQDIYDDNILELDTEAIKPLYDQYVATVEECLNAYKNPAWEDAEGFAGDNIYLEDFISDMKESKVALTDLFKRVADQKPLEEYELNSAFAADGTVGKFDETVSDLIDDYNRLIGM